MTPFIKKYWRTAVMAVLMAGVIVSALTGGHAATTAEIILLACTIVVSASNSDYWRDRCRHAENPAKAAADRSTT
jgi:hypothetical protein